MTVEEPISVARSDAPPAAPVLAAGPDIPTSEPTSVARSVGPTTSSDEEEVMMHGRCVKRTGPRQWVPVATAPVTTASSSSASQPVAAAPTQVGFPAATPTQVGLPAAAPTQVWLDPAAPVSVSACRFSDVRYAVDAAAVTQPVPQVRAEAKAKTRAKVDLQPYRAVAQMTRPGYKPRTSVICRKPPTGNTFINNFPRGLIRPQT